MSGVTLNIWRVPTVGATTHSRDKRRRRRRRKAAPPGSVPPPTDLQHRLNQLGQGLHVDMDGHAAVLLKNATQR